MSATGWTPGRVECIERYPAPLGRCEDGCGAAAVDRHHVDGDTSHNARSNVRFLCRRCHMEADGRLAALAAFGPVEAPANSCANCGRTYKPLRKDRCAPCAKWWRERGEERPYRADGRSGRVLEPRTKHERKARLDELLGLELAA
jgi:hypothetical protein